MIVSVGYANGGIDEPHVHRRITEIYLMARGTSEMRVERETITLKTGDMIVVERGEAHTFVSSSPEHFHFVVHVPGLTGDEGRRNKPQAPRSRPGLR